MTPDNDRDYEQIADKIVGLLGQRAQSESEIAAELDRRGFDLGEDPEDEVAYLLDDYLIDRIALTADGKWISGQAALADRWFTYRVSSDELACDLLPATIDLLPMSLLMPHDGEQPLHGGGSIRFVMRPEDTSLANRVVPDDLIPIAGAFVLEPGALEALGAEDGSLIGLGVKDGEWHLSQQGPDQLADPEPVISAVISLFDDEEVAPPIGMDQVMTSVCIDNPDLLRTPVAPLTEVLGSGGLVLLGEVVAPPDFDVEQWQREGLVRRLRRSYDLDFEQGEATADLLSLVRVFNEIPDGLRADDSHEHEGDEGYGDQDFSVAGTERAGAEPTVGEPSSRKTSEFAAAPGFAEQGFVDAAGESATHGSTNLLDALVPWLRFEPVAEALFAESMDAEENDFAGLALFVAAAMERAPRSSRPGLWWLQGRMWEKRGEPSRAKSCFETALSSNKNWAPALLQLAQIESDSGRPRAALRLLAQAGEGADETLVAILQAQVPQVRTDVPRNAKCPCGSGRKFKQCHMRQDLLPMNERCRWLYQKAVAFLEDNYVELLLPLARIRASHDPTPEGLGQAVRDGLIVDVLLSEGGIFEAFLENRGELLPPDERSLAEQWLFQERSLFDVESVRPGRSLTLRDVRTGDVVDVTERSASLQLSEGNLICTRLLSDGDSWQIFGGVEPVGLHERQQTLALLDSDASPAEIVERLSARFAPPSMQTMEGEAVVFCEATITVERPEVLAAAFDGRYLREDETDGQSRWLELVEVHGADRIRATFELTGDSLHVFCNSEERFDRGLASVQEVDPGRQIASETREPLDMSKIGAGRAGGSFGADEAGQQRREEQRRFQDEALADPAIAEALADIMRKHEESWLEEPIPALEGFTPRQTAADPTRREDLIRLLNSYPSAEGNPGVMDPDRLRAALSL